MYEKYYFFESIFFDTLGIIIFQHVGAETQSFFNFTYQYKR